MAYVRSSSYKTLVTETTIAVDSMPTHQADDVIFAFFGADAGGTWTASAGWTELQDNQTASTCSSSVYYKLAASSSETAPTGTHSATEQLIHYIVVVADADISSFPDNLIEDNQYYGAASGLAVQAPALTVANNNCLILWWAVADGIKYHSLDPGVMALDIPLPIGADVNAYMAWSFQQSSAGTTPRPYWYIGAANDGIGINAIAIRSASAVVPSYCNFSTPPTEIINPLRNYVNVTYFGGGNVDPTADLTGGIGPASVGFSYDAVDVVPSAGVGLLYPALRVSTVNGDTTTIWGAVFDLSTSTPGTSVDLTGKSVCVHLGLETGAYFPSVDNVINGGFIVGLRSVDGTGKAYRFWNVSAINSSPNVGSGMHAATFNPSDSSFAFDTINAGDGSGFDISAIDGLFLACKKGASPAMRPVFSEAHALNSIVIIGGVASKPATMQTFKDSIKASTVLTVQNQNGGSTKQYNTMQGLQLGNGSDSINFKDLNSSMQFADPADATELRLNHNIAATVNGLVIYASANCVINLSNQVWSGPSGWPFTVHASSSASATYTTSNTVIIGAAVTLQDVFTAQGGITFIGCGELTLNNADLSGGCVIDSTTGTQAVTVTSEAQLLDLNNCTFTNNAIAIKITGDQSGTWSGISNISFGSTNTVKIEYTGGTDFAISVDANTDVATGDITNSGAGTLTITAPAKGIVFNGLVAGSQVVVYATTTTTERFRDNSTGTSETYTATIQEDVDYTIMKAGYNPIRVVGYTVGATQSTVSVQQTVDRAYVASSGLTYVTDTLATPLTTKIFTIFNSKTSTVQNYHSHMMETWIDNETYSDFKNVEYPIVPNGSNSFTLKNDWVIEPTDEQFFSRDGMRTLNTAGAVTGVWCAILSVGEMSTFQAEYQQVEGAAPTDAQNTGDVDQLIKIYEDTNGDLTPDFDYTGYLVIKAQVNGYLQAVVDVVAQYGTLADEFYVVGLQPTEVSGFSTGDPSAADIAITDHGASPVTWEGKDYSITITDSAANTGETIMRWINYALSLDATFQGDDPFNWPDMIYESGTKYKTLRGELIGSAGATLKGVRVLRGASVHPDFESFQADDGTVYTVPTSAGVSAANFTAGWAELYNVTTATLVESVETTIGYSKTWTDGTDFTSGDVGRIRWRGVGKEAIQAQFVATADSVVAVLDSPAEDTVYTAYGIDGSAVTEFALDGANVQFDIDDPDSIWYASRLYAWYSYAMVSAAGIATFWGAVTAINTSNIRINSSVVNAYLDNVNATSVRQGDTVVLFRADGIFPQVQPTSGGGGIGIYYAGIGYSVETGVSGLTGAESAKLLSLEPVNYNTVASSVMASEVETGVTLEQSTKLMLSAMAGKISGAGGNTVTIRDINDTADRIVATVDADGNRTGITINVP